MARPKNNRPVPAAVAASSAAPAAPLPSVPQAPGAADERAWRGALSAGAMALLALYLALPDKVYVFDGIMFSGVIERAVSEWRGELFNRRHLLFNPALMGLRDLLARLGVVVPGYELIQRVNAALGVAAALTFLALLRALKLPRWTAAAGAALLAATFAFGARATEGQVYMMFTLAQLWTLLAAVALVAKPGTGRALVLAAAFAAGCVFHVANIVAAPACAAAVLLAWRRGARGALLAAPAAAVLAVLPFCLAFKLSSWSDVMTFVGRTTETQLSGTASASGLLGSALTLHVMSPLSRAITVFQQLFDAFAANHLPAAAAAALGLLLLAAFGVPAARALRDPAKREPAAVLAAGVLAGAAFAAFWQGGEYFWAPPAACLLALALLGAPETPRLPAACGAAAAALLVWNAVAGLLPRSKLENNEGYRRALFVRDHTPPSSWIVVSGLGFANQKVYLAYFAHRSREVLEYYLDRFPKVEALRRFTAFVQANEEAGVPMYLLPDLVDDRLSLDGLKRNWGVELGDIMAAFGPGRLIVVAADGAFRVYLFSPDDKPEPLFAALAYSALTEGDPRRLQELATTMQEVASGMTPARKAAAAALLERSGYGSRLLLQDFGRYMNAENRAAAEQRLARFAAYQKTADFHLRLGNLYRYLARPDLVRREWAIAYKLSGDADLGARLRALK